MLDEYQSEALKIYHRETTEEMLQMLDANLVLRRFRSIMFTLAENDFPEFINDIESFLKKTKLKYGAQSLKDKRIFKLNLNTYPVTSKSK